MFERSLAPIVTWGAFKKDPQRSRAGEPKSKSQFPKGPPKHLSAAEKKCWQEIVRIEPDGPP